MQTWVHRLVPISLPSMKSSLLKILPIAHASYFTLFGDFLVPNVPFCPRLKKDTPFEKTAPHCLPSLALDISENLEYYKLLHSIIRTSQTFQIHSTCGEVRNRGFGETRQALTPKANKIFAKGPFQVS